MHRSEWQNEQKGLFLDGQASEAPAWYVVKRSATSFQVGRRQRISRKISVPGAPATEDYIYSEWISKSVTIGQI